MQAADSVLDVENSMLPAHDAFQQHRDWCNECRRSEAVDWSDLCETGYALHLESNVEAERFIRKIFDEA